MGRQIPPGMERPPEVPSSPPERDGWITQERHYRLITPLFGGGVEPGKVDPITSVSGKGIRGQLRFWWRATRGGRYDGDLEKMKRGEDRIWGRASTPEDKPTPSVQLEVRQVNKGSPFKVQKWSKRQHRNVETSVHDVESPYGYVAFPLRESGEAGRVTTGVEFILKISYPEKYSRDVEAALWAWETFGGVGARTRRGFGAILCTHIDNEPIILPAASLEAMREKIGSDYRQHIRKRNWPLGVPHLTRQLVLTKSRDSSMATWEHLISVLREFRQWRPSTEGKRYPPTLWPEPNAIRIRLNRKALAVAPDLNRFPRAAMGLPIQFEFPQDPSLPKVTLQGRAVDRLASPLIIRPIGGRGGKAIGIAVILATKHADPTELVPGGLQLDGIKQAGDVEHHLTAEEARQVEPLSGEQNALQAFLNYLERNP